MPMVTSSAWRASGERNESSRMNVQLGLARAGGQPPAPKDWPGTLNEMRMMLKRLSPVTSCAFLIVPAWKGTSAP